jgi:hypothetical protein
MKVNNLLKQISFLPLKSVRFLQGNTHLLQLSGGLRLLIKIVSGLNNLLCNCKTIFLNILKTNSF